MLALINKALTLLIILAKYLDNYLSKKQRQEDEERIKNAGYSGIAVSSGGVRHEGPPPGMLNPPPPSASDN